jgi:Lysyl oxidase/Secretion system C-terminal sorting domain
MKHSNLIILLWVMLCSTVYAQKNATHTKAIAVCDTATQYQIKIILKPDNYPQETAWKITDQAGNVLLERVYVAGATQMTTDSVCVAKGNCVSFTITDTYGDGICCAYGNGFYHVFMNNDTIKRGAQFLRKETTTIGCNSAGASCASAIPVSASDTLTAPHSNTWYAFSPTQNGIYTLTTCGLDSVCDTRIWVYDYCTGLLPDSTNVATYAYNDNFCGIRAMVRTNFLAGHTYYIRIGSVQGVNYCADSIRWALIDNGPIVGCTDPVFCTYNPLATVNDSTMCAYPGNPLCQTPDLMIVKQDILNTLMISHQNNADQCLVAEGCMNGYGNREVLRFTTRIENIGNADFYLGMPPATPAEQNAQWRWDQCHNHWHFEGYAEYILYDMNNNIIPIGRKNGFCVMDLDCSIHGGLGKYNCGNQGITKQCGDYYDRSLQCQFVDITALPAGQYKFIVRTNWQRDTDIQGRVESNYDNNWAQTCLNITRDPITGAAQFAIEPNCATYIDCAGDTLGNAVRDCAGACNGTTKTGDISNDGVRTVTDYNMYVAQAFVPTMPLTPCNDLNNDGQFTVSDAALLVDCMLHPQGGLLPNHTHASCQFPSNVTNINDTAYFKIMNFDPTNQTVDVYLRNPTAKVLGYQFGMSGLKITDVTMLTPPPFDAAPRFNRGTGEIIGISLSETPLEKSLQYQPFLRIHFDTLTNQNICIDHVTAVINRAYEKTNTLITEACVQYIGTINNDRMPLNIKVQPNPFTHQTTLRFQNPYQDVLRLEVTDAQGRLKYLKTAITNNEVEIDAQNWESGIYFYRLIGRSDAATGKLVRH